ncbi:MAG: hypothetical protein WA921_00690 [Ahrensia sp.]
MVEDQILDLNWKNYCTDTLDLMRNIKSNKSDVQDIIELELAYSNSIDEEILEFVTGTISEIGGAPGLYDDLMNVLEQGITQTELIEYMNAPIENDPPRHALSWLKSLLSRLVTPKML